jgi:hypothetical protein
MGHAHLDLATAFSSSSCAEGPTLVGESGHDVQFYRTDAQLVAAASAFLADGIRNGQPIVVIATPAHRKAFAESLKEQGLDPDQLFSGRVAVWLDAREALGSFMERGTPNRELFIAAIGSVFERVLDKQYGLVVRGYGEMVDLLWKDGNSEGALELEQLWNELAGKYKFSLLCGYAIDNFLHAAGAEGVSRVCAQHSHALPLTLDDNAA